IDLMVDGKRTNASIGMSPGFRNSGEGDMMLSLSASRIDGQTAVTSKVVMHKLLIREGSQVLGDGTGSAAYVELTGVPGYDGATLRSVDGQADVATLEMNGNIPNAVDAEFKGRFAATTGEGGEFEAGSAPVEISG